MQRLLRRASRVPCSRAFGGSSILGTDTFSASFVADLRDELANAELQRKGAPSDRYINCIRKGEMDHMESPDADHRAKVKLDGMIGSLFDKLPEPQDPMKAALAKTEEEEMEHDHLEALKDEVRERYRRSVRRRKGENKRIDDAMEEVTKGTHRMQSDGPGIDSLVDTEPQVSAAAIREAELQAQVAEMKARVAELERKLGEAGSGSG
jgi:cobalamin biosynthesis protein CbiD